MHRVSISSSCSPFENGARVKSEEKQFGTQKSNDRLACRMVMERLVLQIQTPMAIVSR